MAAKPTFELSLLQTISDWQRGASPARAERLRTAANALPSKFRTCGRRCYRQVGLTKGFVWNLIADDCLREKVSSWTVSYQVARDFKGGVPPQGGDFHGAIVELQRPPPKRVIVNLDRLYKEPGFCKAMEDNRSRIDVYGDGAGRWWNTQQEVVIEVDSVNRDAIRSLGGYSSSYERLTEIVHMGIYAKLGRMATAAELVQLKSRVGPDWIDRDATRRVLSRTEPHLDMLKEIKRQQKEAGLVAA